MKKLLGRLADFLRDGEAVRYIVIGVCTTAVNYAVFALLDKLFGVNENVSNVIAVTASILFAYVTNKLFVFRSHCEGIGELLLEFLKFIGSRLFTMALELLGLPFFRWIFPKLDELIIKLALNVIVIILNYVFGKLLVFRKKKQ